MRQNFLTFLSGLHDGLHLRHLCKQGQFRIDTRRKNPLHIDQLGKTSLPKLELLALPPPISSKTRPKFYYLRPSTWSLTEVTGLSASGSWKMVFVVSFSWRGSADKYKLKICAPTMRNQFYCVCRRHFPPRLGRKIQREPSYYRRLSAAACFFFVISSAKESAFPRGQGKRKGKSCCIVCVCVCK